MIDWMQWLFDWHDALFVIQGQVFHCQTLDWVWVLVFVLVALAVTVGDACGGRGR